MNNCPHEAWDFGALQCPDCGALKDHVTDAEYAKLAAEAQALREEVAKLRARVVVPDGYALVPIEPTVAMRMPWKTMRGHSWYSKYKAMLEAAPRLNGKTVSEGLLRRIAAPVNNQDELDAVHEARIELRALLNQDKENGDHAA
ncbi:hypothetical protein ACKWWR_001720 [Pseudomonas aeruginosa]|uniref:hypothetical protein n=1 Tax=Pseudomonas aeruginosa TaxID=287 RepID=UPI000D8231BF|nr:hypothetical protein [Pseudomonas aeruginosa]MCU8859832.1 hypothetical protein [Pseudomonas aeruginosa]MCU8885430.1 hypothetical protein [Pseudomonas aeruginosa]MCU8897257.1 hypothetical protein [Pseudomonas aeruginosa]MCU8904127.1 hypothetical protein [Pseudomonas aeruginosa]MCU8910119.1 hypothetical protein [Pseudomonas aeruginosa]